MNCFLLRVIRSVIRADSDPARQTLFATLMQSHRQVRFVYAVHERLRGTWASALLVSIYGLASLVTIALPRARVRVLSLAKHANARHQVARVTAWIGTADCGAIRTGAPALFPAGLAGLGTLRSPRHLLRALRTIRTLDRRYGFLVACRSAGAIAWYSRAMTALRTARPGAVLVSSDSHPEELAFVAAARELAIPQIFVSHAYPTPLSPPLDFSLSILEGEAALDARRRKGPVRGTVLLAGLEGDSAPLDPRRLETARPSIGIFPPKALSWTKMAAIIGECRERFGSRQIVIRWHPSMLDRSRLADVIADRADIVETPPAAALADVARQCDWVIADENSNVHLLVLKLGIPTVAIKGLGLYPESRTDQYGFVANGIVFPPIERLGDMDRRELTAFFSDQWARRFARYDASYLHPNPTIERDVRTAVFDLLSSRPVEATSA